MTELTSRQEAFCQAYAETPNGAAAARSAGYGEASARNRAAELLAKPEIADRIETLRVENAADRDKAAAALAAKLEPFYAQALADGDVVMGLQIVHEQARIQRHVQGASAVQIKAAVDVEAAAGTAEREHAFAVWKSQIEHSLGETKRLVSFIRDEMRRHGLFDRDSTSKPSA